VGLLWIACGAARAGSGQTMTTVDHPCFFLRCFFPHRLFLPWLLQAQCPHSCRLYYDEVSAGPAKMAR